MATTKIHEPDDAIHKEFKSLVNMSAATLEKWLGTEESKRVGWKGEDGKGSGESVGHKEGERIVEILHKKQADLDAEDEKHMHKVVCYIKRHMAQKPDGDTSETNWAYSLKNWGHDPSHK